MKKKPSTKTYTLDEVSTYMEKYVDDSVVRLRSRLKQAWKKQAKLKVGWYNEAAASLVDKFAGSVMVPSKLRRLSLEQLIRHAKKVHFRS